MADVNHILGVLTNLQTNDNALRLAAEQSVAQMASVPHALPSLLRIVDLPEAPESTKLYAMVLLKQLVTDHWDATGSIGDDSDGEDDQDGSSSAAHAQLSQAHIQYEQQIYQLRRNQQTFSDEDKHFIRQHLPQLLGHPTTPISTSAATIIAEIGSIDYPQQWPELVDGLVQALNSHENVPFMHGAIKCLTYLIESVIDNHLFSTLDRVATSLLSIVTAKHQGSPAAQNPSLVQLHSNGIYQFPSALRTDAFHLYTAYLSAFAMLEDPGAKGFEGLFREHLQHNLRPMLEACLQTITTGYLTCEHAPHPHFSKSFPAIMLECNLTPEDLQNHLMISTRGAALGLINKVLTLFPRSLKESMDVPNVLMHAVKTVFHQSIPVYLDNCIFSDNIDFIASQYPSANPHIAQYLRHTSYFNDLRLYTSLMLNNCIFFMTLLSENTRLFPKLLLQHLGDFVPGLCRLALITSSDVDTFQTDPNEFAASESTLDVESSYLGVGGEAGTVVRKEAGLFLDTLLNKWSLTGGKLVATASIELWCLGDQLKQLQLAQHQTLQQSTLPTQWWLYQEVALFCLGHLLRSEKAFERQDVISVETIVQNYLFPTLNAQNNNYDDSDSVFLQARSSWLISQAVCNLTNQMQEQLYNEQMNDAQENYFKIKQLLSLLINSICDTPIVTRISAAQALSICTSAISVLETSQLINTCKSTDQAAPAKSIQIVFNSIFSNDLPRLLNGLCTLTDGVSDEGLHCVLSTLHWILNFISEWNETVSSLHLTYPHIQFEIVDQQESTSHGKYARLLPNLIPHTQAVLPHIASISHAVYTAWEQHSNNTEIGEVAVDILRSLCNLPGGSEIVASSIFDRVYNFIRAPHVDSISKLAGIGFIAIMLRAVSPGIFAPSIDPPNHIPSNTFTAKTISTHLPPEYILLNVLPTLLEIGMSTSDKVLVYGVTAVTATIFAIYNPYIIENAAIYPEILSKASGLALRLFPTQDLDGPLSTLVPPSTEPLPDLNDADTMIACRVVTQLVITFKQQLPPELLQHLHRLIVVKACTAKEYKLRISCLFIIARLGISDPVYILNFLHNFGSITIPVKELGPERKSVKTGRPLPRKVITVQKQVSLIQHFFNTLLHAIQDSYSVYCKRILTTFLTIILTFPECQTLLSSFHVDGQQKINSNESSPDQPKVHMTRRQALTTAQEIDQYVQVDCASRCFEVVVSTANDFLQVKIKGDNIDDDANLSLFDHDDDGEEHSEGDELGNDGGNSSSVDDLFGDINSFNLSDLLSDDSDQNTADLADIQGDQVDYPDCYYDTAYGTDVVDAAVAMLNTIGADSINSIVSKSIMAQDCQLFCQSLHNYALSRS